MVVCQENAFNSETYWNQDLFAFFKGKRSSFLSNMPKTPESVVSASVHTLYCM